MIPKFLEHQISKPGVLVFNEKHDKRLFICSTKEDFCRAAMKVLRGRLKDGYWYYDDELDPDEKAAQDVSQYAGAVYRPRALSQDLTKASAISKDNDLEAALVFLHSRSYYEYEGMTIERGEDY